MRLFLLAALILTFSTPALAQARKGAVPDVPAPLQVLVEKGAQIRYLGTEHGMEGWIAMYQGQEQYYYVTGDKKAFVTGLMFGEDGRPITIEQVQQLQAQGDGVLDLLAADPATRAPSGGESAATSTVSDAAKTQTPAERMFADVERSNWLRLGGNGAPAIYSFIDPQCPHCHEFINELRQQDYIGKNAVQVRAIPVGFAEGSLAQAAFLLAAPDAQDRFYKHLDGDKEALPAKNDISTQAIQKNMALMQAWKFNVTPLTIYRSRSGEIKIVRGKPKDLAGLIADLPAPVAP